MAIDDYCKSNKYKVKKNLIIEIGPGAGALTKCLKQYNSQIIAYEVDTDTKKYLQGEQNV